MTIFKNNPSQKDIKAQLEFLATPMTVASDEFIKQCNDCIHARHAPYDKWCDQFECAPTGICMSKKEIDNG